MYNMYLGDAVYAALSPVTGDLVLHTSDGYSKTNTIVLEDQVLESLLVFLKQSGKIK